MKWTIMSEQERIQRLQLPEGKIRIVLDTDAYNEIDDQFAIAYALASQDRLDVEAIYAAPFHNKRSENAQDGMEKSYDEILRLLQLWSVPAEQFVYKGSRDFLSHPDRGLPSAATEDLIQRALRSSGDDPLYVLAIGAITNVASAILLEPKIVDHIVVIWLGGHALHWSHTKEFNLKQDIYASRLILDCGVPLVQIPCLGVTSHLLSSMTEIETHLRDAGEMGRFLTQRFREYHHDHYAYSKVIWDIAAIAWLINPSWLPGHLVHSPVLTDQVTWSVDPGRHFIHYVSMVHRDPIFKDMFTKLTAREKAGK